MGVSRIFARFTTIVDAAGVDAPEVDIPDFSAESNDVLFRN